MAALVRDLRSELLPAQRAAAIYALAGHGKAAEAAIPDLLRLLVGYEAPDPRVANPNMAARLLSRLPPDPVEPALIAVLARLGAPAVPGLVALLPHENPTVCIRATRALTRMGEGLGPAALELRRVFRRSEPEVLLEALAGCAELGRAVRVLTPDLVELLESRSTEVADRAMDALATVGAAAVPSLQQALGHQRNAVRLRAAIALRRIGPAASPALAALQALERDPDSEVRAAAASAIVRITEALR